MPTPQGGLQPLIGYAMYAIGKLGGDLEAVQAQMERIAGERGWPVSLIPEAINQANLNREATLAAKEAPDTARVGDLFGGAEVAPTMVGARVVLVVKVTAGGLPPHYETVSVVINVPPGMTASDILLLASQYWFDHANRERYGEPELDTAASPGVVALFEGGYEGAELVS